MVDVGRSFDVGVCTVPKAVKTKDYNAADYGASLPAIEQTDGYPCAFAHSMLVEWNNSVLAM